jgi:DNA-binding transcriptional ArsR family regulator
MTKLLSKISTFIPCCLGEFTQEDRDLLIKVSKALGNEARFEIYSFLKEQGTCMTSDLVDYLPLAQSTISQHLKVLKASGVVIGTIDGPSTDYCIDRDLMSRYHQLLGRLI